MSPLRLPATGTGTDTERATLNCLWSLVEDRRGYLTPTRKPVGWGPTGPDDPNASTGAPATGLERLLATDALTARQKDELVAYRDSLNPAKMRQAHP